MTMKCTDRELQWLYGNRYIELRINDSFKGVPEKTQHLLYGWADRLHELRQESGVLIHCYGGRNRSCLLAGLVLVRGGMSGEQALQTIESQQPKALYNPAFRDLLQNSGWKEL